MSNPSEANLTCNCLKLKNAYTIKICFITVLSGIVLLCGLKQANANLAIMLAGRFPEIGQFVGFIFHIENQAIASSFCPLILWLPSSLLIAYFQYCAEETSGEVYRYVNENYHRNLMQFRIYSCVFIFLVTLASMLLSIFLIFFPDVKLSIKALSTAFEFQIYSALAISLAYLQCTLIFKICRHKEIILLTMTVIGLAIFAFYPRVYADFEAVIDPYFLGFPHYMIMNASALNFNAQYYSSALVMLLTCVLLSKFEDLIGLRRG